MPEGWGWDESLFRGTAGHYVRGRLPYPPALQDAFAAAAELGGSPRLIDVGCGPGKVALLLADLFTEVVGVDPDSDMLVEAARIATKRGVARHAWLSNSLRSRLALGFSVLAGIDAIKVNRVEAGRTRRGQFAEDS